MAIALGLGTMVGWKRIVVTVGEKIGKTHLTYAQGAAAELVAAVTIMRGRPVRLPVSTTHILSSGVAGTMAANGSGLQRAPCATSPGLGADPAGGHRPGRQPVLHPAPRLLGPGRFDPHGLVRSAGGLGRPPGNGSSCAALSGGWPQAGQQQPPIRGAIPMNLTRRSLTASALALACASGPLAVTSARAD